MIYFDVEILPYSHIIDIFEDIADDYSQEEVFSIREQILNKIKPLATKIRNLPYIEYSQPNKSPETVDRGLSTYINFKIKCDETIPEEDINKIYKYSIRFSEHKDKHGKCKNRLPVELKGKTLSDLYKSGWNKFEEELEGIQKKIREYEIEKFGEQKTFITDEKPKETEKAETEITDDNSKKENESLKLRIRENNKKGCFNMKLKIREGFEDVYRDGDPLDDAFSVVKEYLEKEFNPTRLDDLIYDFKEIPFDEGWFAEIIFTNTATGQRAKFTCEYKDAYSGLLYATYNYGKETVFYTQKDFVDWLAEQVEWRLY